MVVRLVGTNKAEGRRILADAGIPVLDARSEECATMLDEDDMEDE
jgi:succinyl-CoA synthetase beta subunit